MERDHIGLGQQPVEIRQLDLELGRRVGRQVGVEGEDRHPEPLGAPGDLTSHPPEADQAHGLAGQLHADEPGALPLTAAQAALGGRQAAG
jgi:hypothetical protein